MFSFPFLLSTAFNSSISMLTLFTSVKHPKFFIVLSISIPSKLSYEFHTFSTTTSREDSSIFDISGKLEFSADSKFLPLAFKPFSNVVWSASSAAAVEQVNQIGTKEEKHKKQRNHSVLMHRVM